MQFKPGPKAYAVATPDQRETAYDLLMLVAKAASIYGKFCHDNAVSPSPFDSRGALHDLQLLRMLEDVLEDDEPDEEPDLRAAFNKFLETGRTVSLWDDDGYGYDAFRDEVADAAKALGLVG